MILDTVDLKERLKDFYSSDSEIINIFKNDLTIDLIIDLARTRMKTLADFKLLMLEESVNPRSGEEKEIGVALINRLENINEENWNKDHIFVGLKDVMTEKNIKMPILYYILTGKERGLPLPEHLEAIKKRKTLERLHEFVK